MCVGGENFTYFANFKILNTLMALKRAGSKKDIITKSLGFFAENHL